MPSASATRRTPRTRHLVDGVVRGVGGYGNCVGVPTVGGELVFDPSYGGNPLVNVMAIGLLEERLLTLAAAPGPGNLVVLYGSATGRDGIGGASVLASATFSDDDPSKRPSVQVGDPFAEKLLIEASLELIERGLVEGLQDLGAGGHHLRDLGDRRSGRDGDRRRPRRDPAARAGARAVRGDDLRVAGTDVRRGPARQVGRGPRGVRALGAPGRGHRAGDGRWRHHDRDRRPRPRRPPRRRCARAGADPGPCADQRRDRPSTGGGPADASPRRPGTRRTGRASATGSPNAGWIPGAVLLALLGSANLASRHAVFHQYDSTVGADTVAGPGRGAAVLRVKGTRKALVATTDGNQAVGAVDPWLGAALSVAEATRNVSITGARPLGVTNCLNYGDPTRPAAFWQLSEGVRGLGDACRALGLPVTGGNVSLYNESPAGAIAPTAEIGVVGLLDDIGSLVGPAFTQALDTVLLVGDVVPGLVGSDYAALAGATTEDDPPALDLVREAALQAFVREAIARGLVASAQDISGGGLAVALAECAMWGGLGASVGIAVGHSPAVDLFGESPSRLLLTCRPRYAAALALLARQHGLPVEPIGTVGGDRLVIELAMAGASGNVEDRGGGVADALEVPLRDLRHAWDHGLARALGWEGG